jgi:predicted DNA-binding protein (UPF0251 family)
MPRPRKPRLCRRYRADRVYKPQGIPMRDIAIITLSLDEFEALRLCDVENLDQEQAGTEMGVSRGTIQRLIYHAREKLVRAIIDNNAILINLRGREVCDADMHTDQRRRRSRRHRV